MPVLAHAFSISISAVQNALEERGIARRSGRRVSAFTPTGAQLKDILARYKAGETASQIASLYGTNWPRIRALIIQANGQIRGRRVPRPEMLELRRQIGETLKKIRVQPATRKVLELLAKHPDFSYARIGKLCGHSRQHVQHCLQAHAERLERLKPGSVERRGKKPDLALMREVVEMYAHYPASDVAKGFGISTASVVTFAGKLGFSKRTGWKVGK
jgi:hypothetical protein